MAYQGDYTPAKSVVFNFNTASFSDGSPITLAGTPALSVYKNSTTESTSGVTLTVDYDSRTGMHHVVIDTSADGTFYAAGNDFDVVITTGTVGGTSVVGRKVGAFSLSNRSALRPATADRTIVVDSAGLADANTVKLGPSGSGSAQTARDIGASVLLSSGTGTGQLDFTSGVVKGNVTQLLGAAWLTPGTAGTPDVNAKLIGGQTASLNANNLLKVSLNDILATALTETSGQLAGGFKKFFNITTPASTMDALTLVATATNLTNAPTNGDFTATMKTSIGTAVAASAVSSVTGNVGGNVTGSVGSVASGGITNASVAADVGFKSVRSGTCQSGSTTTTIVLDSGASATSNIYRGLAVHITGGTGFGQAPRRCTGYNGATRAITVDWAWTTTPDNTTTFALTPFPGASLTYVSGVGLCAMADLELIQTNPDGPSNLTGLVDDYIGGTLNANLNGNVSGTVARCTLTDTLTTYTGNTPQTGDAFARIGSTGVGLTSLAPASTALSTGTWTNALASDLGHLTLRSGTAQGGSSTTITLDSGASATDNLYQYLTVSLTGNTGAGQSRTITAYTGASKVCIVDPPWQVAPDNTTTFSLSPTPTPSIPTAAAISGAVWSDLTRTLTSGGVSAIQSGLATSAALSAVSAKLPSALIGGRIDATVGAMQADVLTAAAAAADFGAEIQALVTGGAYALNTDSGGNVKISDGTGANQIDTVSGAIAHVVLVDTTTNLTNAPTPADSPGVTTLLARLTSARGGYLDNLSAGAVATAASIAALNNISQAQVKAQVVAGLSTDTYTEPTGVPTATTTIADKVGRLYKALMRGVEVTADAKTFLDAGDAPEWKKTLSDDGTTYAETSALAP